MILPVVREEIIYYDIVQATNSFDAEAVQSISSL